MKYYNILLVRKSTLERKLYTTELLSEDKAEKICEEWGWSYGDEKERSWYMEVIEIEI